VTPRYGKAGASLSSFRSRKSRPYFWPKNAYTLGDIGSSSAPGPGLGRNAEKLGVIIPKGSGSSIVGGPGEKTLNIFQIFVDESGIDAIF